MCCAVRVGHERRSEAVAGVPELWPASFSAGLWRKLLAFGDISSARNGVGDCPVHCRTFSILDLLPPNTSTK